MCRHTRVSRADGGQLNYLLSSPEGSLLVSASAGYWSGIMRELRPDVAVLSIAGRPNLDGEPFQGSHAQFIAGEVETLRPRRVVFCHHDAWLPPLPAMDVEPVARELARRAPRAEVGGARLQRSDGDPALTAVLIARPRPTGIRPCARGERRRRPGRGAGRRCDRP